MGPAGARARGREVGGGWRKLEGGRPEGARGREAGKARSTGDLWELDREADWSLLPCLRSEREADGSSRGRSAGGQRHEGWQRMAGEGRWELELEHGRPPSRWRRTQF
jgi:hypothetical protein